MNSTRRFIRLRPPRKKKQSSARPSPECLWSKQIYLWDVNRWLEGDNPKFPPPESRKQMRNIHWRHLNSMRILSMPDKWEFPWFAAWDLAFQCITLALVDPEFAKENLWVLLFEQFQHPNGQIPAYEWEFSDLNPPVHAWACWRVYQMEKQRTGKGDTVFLEKCLHKLLMNFAWWVNRVDSEGNNVFEGGFLGLDNIAVVDRGEKFPNGAILEQSDATGWMGFFCLYLMRIALELANQNRVYEGVATKFFEHFIYIGAAMKKMGGRNYQLWDEQEGFFYDVLRYPNGEFHKFRLRSLVGPDPAVRHRGSRERRTRRSSRVSCEMCEWFIQNRPDLVGDACYTVGDGQETLRALNRRPQSVQAIVERIWDPEEFLSPYGIRSLSKYHEQHPFQFGRSLHGIRTRRSGGQIERRKLQLARAHLVPHLLSADSFVPAFRRAVGSQFSLPTAGSDGQSITPHDMAREAANRMISIFKRGADGSGPVSVPTRSFRKTRTGTSALLFNEYYHGDSGMGLGASHQTGWSGLVANLIDEWRR